MLSKIKLEMLKLSGQVAKVTIMPEELGGDPNDSHNILWLYKAAASQKENFDKELIRLADELGGDWNYVAEPTYKGVSAIAESLALRAASRGGDVLTMTIANSADVDPTKMPQFTEGTGERSQAENEAPFAGGDGPLGDGPFEELWLEHAASSFDKQLQIGDYLDEGWSWTVDTQTSVLALRKKSGETANLPIQMLGSESQQSGTWLWAWANAESELPPSLVAASTQLHDIGEIRKIVEFTNPQFGSEHVTGEKISMIASGMLKARGYFRGPYDGGAIFLVISDFPELPPVSHPIARITTVFPQLLSACTITDQPAAFEAYAHYYGLVTTLEKNTVIAKHAQLGQIVASFDSQCRLVNLKATMEPTNSA